MAGTVTLLTPSQGLYLLREAFSTATAFPALDTTITRPSGEGVIESDYKTALFYFMGTDAANEAFNARIIRWEKVARSNDVYQPGINPVAADLWVPTVLWTGLVTLGAMVGKATTHLSTTVFFADTLAAAGTPPATVTTYSPADDGAGYVRVEHDGTSLFEVQFDMTTAASGNALVRFF